MDISNSFNSNVGLNTKDARRAERAERDSSIGGDPSSQADQSREGASLQRVTEASASTENENSRSSRDRAKQDMARAALSQIASQTGGTGRSAAPSDVEASQIARSQEEATKNTENETARDSNQKSKIEMIDL